MANFKSIDEMAKEIAERAKQEIVINDMPLEEFINKINNAAENNECHLITCKNNCDCHCTHDDMRKQCVYTALLILCLEDRE